MNTIVVGVDGSESSLAALRFAVEEARLRGDRVKAVAAWHVPSIAYGGAFAPATPEPRTFETVAADRLREAIAAVAGEEPDVPVQPVVREGDPAHILLEEAVGAEQLVLGCHEYAFVRRLFHHSVSEECAHDAHCPVTVVHHG
jgi:nucleotide-binding universal stress UspA family protein